MGHLASAPEPGAATDFTHFREVTGRGTAYSQEQHTETVPRPATPQGDLGGPASFDPSARAMHVTRLTTADLTALRQLVATRDGPGIVVWCLERGGFRDAGDPYALRWVSPDGTADIAIGLEQGHDLQVLALGQAILAT